MENHVQLCEQDPGSYTWQVLLNIKNPHKTKKQQHTNKHLRGDTRFWGKDGDSPMERQPPRHRSTAGSEGSGWTTWPLLLSLLTFLFSICTV